MKDRYRGHPEYDAVRDRLIEAARSPDRTVQYRPHIARLIGIADDERGDHVRGDIGYVLGEIAEDEVRAGRPMLSAVAVNQDGEPSPPFFTFARELGFAVVDETEFWIRELQRCVDYWTTH